MFTAEVLKPIYEPFKGEYVLIAIHSAVLASCYSATVLILAWVRWRLEEYVASMVWFYSCSD